MKGSGVTREIYNRILREDLYTGDKKLAFHFPHAIILGTHHCGKEPRKEFKIRVELHNVLCRSDYSERVVSSFYHQNQSKYYDENMYLSIVGIALEDFSDSQQPSPFLASDQVSRHKVFNYFLLYDRKQDASTTYAYSKRIIEILQNRQLLFAYISIIW